MGLFWERRRREVIAVVGRAKLGLAGVDVEIRRRIGADCDVRVVGEVMLLVVDVAVRQTVVVVLGDGCMQAVAIVRGGVARVKVGREGREQRR